jgi:NAD(P)H-hydrate epimerase
MKVVKAEEMQEIDRKTIEELGVPGAVLMENAGVGCVEEIERFAENIGMTRKDVTIFCGKGNNGGDGFVIARHLFNRGWKPKIFLVGEKKALSGDADLNCKICESYGLNVVELTEDNFLLVDFEDTDLIIDAIFGTGIKGAVRGFAQEVIKKINQSEIPVFSVDIPSGLPTDTANPEGVCVKADMTCTMGLPKISQTVYPGKKYVGELVVLDIGFPRALLNNAEITVNLTNPEFIASRLPDREPDAYKGSCGYLSVIAGSVGMTGAATLTCQSAYLAGAGYVKLAIPKTLNNIMEIKLTETLTFPLYETHQHSLSVDADIDLPKFLEGVDCVTIGPGLSRNTETSQLVRKYVRKIRQPMVIDADGLNALSTDSSILWNAHDKIVLTPHVGEMARLTGIDKREIMADPVHKAKDTAEKFGVVLVLKGAATVVASPKGKVFVNTTGNAGMATAGAGDVLTGIISGLIVQGMNVFDAAIVGVYLHGLAGDVAAQKKGELSVIATDIMNNIPDALLRLRKR